VVAKRTDVDILAGESTYAELGIDAGVVGLAAFVLWSLALLLALVRREPWVTAAVAVVLLLGLQTDVIGIHWLAAALWGAAGIAISPAAPVVDAEPPPPLAAAPTAGERPPVEQDD
jgi:hypothetical protein